MLARREVGASCPATQGVERSLTHPFRERMTNETQATEGHFQAAHGIVQAARNTSSVFNAQTCGPGGSRRSAEGGGDDDQLRQLRERKRDPHVEASRKQAGTPGMPPPRGVGDLLTR